MGDNVILGGTLLGLGTLIMYINLTLMEFLKIEMTITKTGKELQTGPSRENNWMKQVCNSS